MRINLDQIRGIIHYPYNCGRCLTTDISRGRTNLYMIKRFKTSPVLPTSCSYRYYY